MRAKSFSACSKSNFFEEKSKQSNLKQFPRTNQEITQSQQQSIKRHLEKQRGKFRVAVKTKDNNNKTITKQYSVKQVMLTINNVSQSLLIIKNINKTEMMEEKLIIKDNNNFLLNSFTHELRTPLNCSQQHIEQLIDLNISDDTIQNILFSTRNSMKLLQNQLNDILDFAAIQLDDFEYQYNDFSVEQILQDVQSIFQPAAKQKNIDFSYQIQQKLFGQEVRIQNDDKRITQILINLMNNSIKYTRENGKIRIFLEQCSLGKYLIRVWDNGIGIQKQRLEIIKHTLFSDQKEQDLDVSYVGIGLMVCNQLVQGLVKSSSQNNLIIDSKLEEWTEIGFFLEDLAEQNRIYDNFDDEFQVLTPSQQMFNLNLMTQTVKSLSFQKIITCSCSSILIVDDVPFNHLAFNLTLKQFKLNCDKAYDGLDALQKVAKRIESKKDCNLFKCQTYRIIFMDIDMPIMDGITATREINNFLTSKNLHTNIIICSAFDGKDINSSALKAGAVDFLKKPVEKQNLSQILSSYFL